MNTPLLPKSVDPRTPLYISVTSDIGEIDLDAVAALSERAFRHNYRGKLRALCDVDYYEWLLGGGNWLGVVALNDDGQPVGCMFALLRTMSVCGESFPASYSTAWASDPAYRRTGVSLRVWQTMQKEVRRRGLLGIGASHAGLSGTRADVVFRPDGERGVPIAHHSGAIWSLALGPKPALPRAAQDLPLQRIARGAEPAPGSLADFARGIASSALMTNALELSFADFYLDGAQQRSGTFWFPRSGGGACAIGYALFALALDDVEVGVIGRIQFVLRFDCDDAHASAALQRVCEFLRTRGCSSASLVEHFGVTPDMLRACGFTRTDEEVAFGVCAPPSLAERLCDRAPLLVDFI